MTGCSSRARAFAVLLALGWPGAALAFDPWGFFSGRREESRLPQAASLPYALGISGVEPGGEIEQALRDTAILARLADEPPADGLDLVRRAQTDLPKLTDLLWGLGYYAARLNIEVAGQRLSFDVDDSPAAARAAESHRNRSLVPVRIVVETGPRYAFASVVVEGGTGEGAPQRLYAGLVGAPAQSSALIAAAGRIRAHFREQGHPYAAIADPEPIIDHRRRTVSVTLVVKPGPRAPLGAVHISGADNIDAGVIRSFIYTESGLLFSPTRLSDIRRSVGRIEAIGSVRVQPREKLDADGSVPIDVQVTERPLRVLGGNLRFSNADGPDLGTYWAHRNLFGGAERLRLSGDVFYLPGSFSQNRNARFDANNVGGKLDASFLKPALNGSRVDFLFDASVGRTASEAFVSRNAAATGALRYRFADKTWAQAGLLGEVGQAHDIFGRQSYRLIGLPLSGHIDTTDNDLDPGQGFRLSGSLTPALGYGDVGRSLLAAKVQASAYHAFDEERRAILAGRVALGSVTGGGIARIPASWRMFAGGGGSVRGYEYRSIAPRDAFGRLIGGRSLFEASLEARFRVTETIGIVPFVDTGAAFDTSFPGGGEALRWGVGLGLRYHTAIGPIRLDLATPLNRRRGEQPFAFYISLGQAF